MQKLNYKKILLVHPLGYKTDYAKKDISRVANIMPPIGLASLSSYLEKQSVDSAIIDCYARPDSKRLIRDYLTAERPGFIGFSCTTSSFLDGVRIAADAKVILPDIKVIFGGPHVSALKKKLLADFPVIDFICVGEGEETLSEIIKHEARDISSIQGLIFREDNNEICFTGYRTKGLDIDTLPFPAYEKLGGYPGAYKLPIFNYPKAPNTSCISSRGCPYACTYCDRSVFRRTFRFNSAEYMYDHLKYLKKKFNIRHINFYDDQFTFNRDRVEGFTQKLIDKPLGMTFNCAARSEHIDFELLKQMKAAGCWMISLGIETGDENLLSQHRQNANLDLVSDKLHLIKKAGIRTKGLFMIGLPGETEESVKKSMNYLFSNPIDDFNLAKFTPFPGSPLYERIHLLGTFDEDWEKMDCMNLQFVPNGMTKERLEELFIQFYKTHFKHNKVLLGYVAMLWKSPDSWLRFIKNLFAFLRFTKGNKRLGS